MQSIPEIFDAFSNLRVLVIGDLMVDAYIWGSVERISPEAPVPVVRATRRDFRLGGAGNVALNVQALGADVMVCSVVGKDDQGEQLIKRLEERSISTEGIVKSQYRPTTVKTRVMTSHQHIVRVDEEVENSLNEEEQKEAIIRIGRLIKNSDVIIFEDYDKGVITPEIIAFTVEQARAQEIPVVVDPKKRNFLDYKGVTLFKPNLKELREGLNINVKKDDIEGLKQAVRALQHELTCEGILITLSEHGVLVDYKNEVHHIPAHKREISDVSGAGDTVVSIAAMCVALDLPPKMIAALSNLGGGLVCEHVGVVPIDKEALQKEADDEKWI